MCEELFRLQLERYRLKFCVNLYVKETMHTHLYGAGKGSMCGSQRTASCASQGLNSD